MNLLTLLKKEDVSRQNRKKIGKFLSDIEPGKRLTVEENLFLMYSKKQGGMINLSLNESIAGTGGNIIYDGRQIPCSTVNFYFESETGEILYFQNPQWVPEEIKEKGIEGFFRLAVDRKTFSQFIVKTRVQDSTPLAKEVIGLTAQAYNLAWGYQNE